MRQPNVCRSVGKVVTLLVLVAACWARGAQAGETTVYLKSGWFEWEEKLQGSTFVKEEGFLHAAGISRSEEIDRLALDGLLEVWGGEVDYDGHDVTGSFPINSDTIYIGTREEFSAGYRVFADGSLSIAPMVALGHKFWVRTRSGEDWNLFYGKAGVGGEWKTGKLRFFARGGALIPIYTRNHVTLSDAGYEDVTVEPKSDVSGYAEGGVRVGAVTVSVEYEGLSFSQSDSVTTKKLNATGAVIVNDQAFQPPSDSSLISLKVAYSF